MDYHLYKGLTNQLQDVANILVDFHDCSADVLVVLDDLMSECEDDFVRDNQGRADQGKGPSFAGRDLFIAMQVFMETVDRVRPPFQLTPEPLPDPFPDGSNILHGRTAKEIAHEIWRRCIDWTYMMTAWFPVLMDDMFPRPTGNGSGGQTAGKILTETEQFKEAVKENDLYKNAVADGSINPPFTWNKSKRELADFVSRVVPKKTDSRGFQHPRWSVADGVFFWRGKAVSGKDLNQTYQHTPIE